MNSGVLKNWGFSSLRVIIPLISIPILSRVFTKDQLGNYAAVISLASWISILIDFGMTYSLPRLLNSQGYQKNNVYFVSQLFKMVLFSVVSLLLYALTSFWGLDKDVILAGGILGLVQGLTPIWFFIYKERFSEVVLSDLIVQAMLALVGIGFVSKFGISGVTYTYIFTTMLFLRLIYMHFKVTKNSEDHRPTKTVDFKLIFSESYKLLLSRLVSSTYTALSGFLVYAYSNGVTSAVFNNSSRISKSTIFLNDVAVNTIFGKIGRLDSHEREVELRRLLTLVVSINLLLCLIIILFSKEVVDVLLGTRYRGSEIYIKAYALSMIPIAYTYVIGVLWTAVVKREDLYLKSMTISAIIFLPTSIICLKSNLGLMGFIMSLVALEFSNAILVSLFLCQNGVFPRLARFSKGR